MLADPLARAATARDARAVARSGRWWLPVSLVLLAGALFLGVMVGPAGNWGAADWNIIWNVRMPRVVLAGIVGLVGRAERRPAPAPIRPGGASTAMAVVVRLVAQLPKGIGLVWTGQSYQERSAGALTPLHLLAITGKEVVQLSQRRLDLPE